MGWGRTLAVGSGGSAAVALLLGWCRGPRAVGRRATAVALLGRRLAVTLLGRGLAVGVAGAVWGLPLAMRWLLAVLRLLTVLWLLAVWSLLRGVVTALSWRITLREVSTCKCFSREGLLRCLPPWLWFWVAGTGPLSLVDRPSNSSRSFLKKDIVWIVVGS